MGAAVTDLEDGASFHVRANQVVNATGVWADDLRDGAPATPSVTVRASKGSHIVVARDRIEADGGIIVRTRSSVLLVIPWGPGHWLIGTTDTDPTGRGAEGIARPDRGRDRLPAGRGQLAAGNAADPSRRHRFLRRAAAAGQRRRQHGPALARARRQRRRARARDDQWRQVHDVPGDGGRGHRPGGGGAAAVGRRQLPVVLHRRPPARGCRGPPRAAGGCRDRGVSGPRASTTASARTSCAATARSRSTWRGWSPTIRRWVSPWKAHPATCVQRSPTPSPHEGAAAPGRRDAPTYADRDGVSRPR